MTAEEIRNIIMGQIASAWATATEICWPNQMFNEPNAAWIRPTIKFGESFVGELGENGVGLRTGVLMIQVFGLANSGIKISLQYASRLETMFRRKDLDGVLFNEPATDINGLGENGYWHTLVSIPFTTWVGE